MGTPEDMPEDRQESYPCPNCPDGNITKDPKQGNMWQCDSCDWMPPLRREDVE